MLTKLLKYDLKNLFKKLLPVYLVSLAICSITDIMLIITDKISALDFVSGLMLVFSILLIILTPIAAFVDSIIDFNSKLVKDEGYLIHTLPVKKSSIVISKIIASIITLVASFISSIISLVVLTISHYDYYSTILNDIGDIIEMASNSMGILFIILILLNISIGFILNLLNIFASISLGQMHNGNKTLFSVIYYIATYYVMQIITSLIILMPMLLNSNLWKQMEMDIPPRNTLNLFLGLSLILSIASSVIFYVITTKVLDKKLNLE